MAFFVFINLFVASFAANRLSERVGYAQKKEAHIEEKQSGNEGCTGKYHKVVAHTSATLATMVDRARTVVVSALCFPKEEIVAPTLAVFLHSRVAFCIVAESHSIISNLFYNL
jgi:hypothetical protein